MSQATAERRKQIMTQLLDRKQVTVKELAAEMEVSGATVRRDLKALGRRAGSAAGSWWGRRCRDERDFSFQARQMRAVEEKRIIGQLASSLDSRWRPCVPRFGYDLLGTRSLRQADARSHDPDQQRSVGT